MFELVRQSFSKAPRVGILDYDWLNPIDLGISSYHLFLNFLLQLTRNGSPFPESHPISHLTVKLFRIIYILSSSLLRPVAHLPIWGTPFANVWQKVRMRVWHRVALLFLLPAWIRTMKKLQSQLEMSEAAEAGMFMVNTPSECGGELEGKKWG